MNPKARDRLWKGLLKILDDEFDGKLHIERKDGTTVVVPVHVIATRMMQAADMYVNNTIITSTI